MPQVNEISWFNLTLIFILSFFMIYFLLSFFSSMKNSSKCTDCFLNNFKFLF